jgi:hypothetical protein
LAAVALGSALLAAAGEAAALLAAAGEAAALGDVAPGFALRAVAATVGSSREASVARRSLGAPLSASAARAGAARSLASLGNETAAIT